MTMYVPRLVGGKSKIIAETKNEWEMRANKTNIANNAAFAGENFILPSSPIHFLSQR